MAEEEKEKTEEQLEDSPSEESMETTDQEDVKEDSEEPTEDESAVEESEETQPDEESEPEPSKSDSVEDNSEEEEGLPEFRVGDTVRVHYKIEEAGKIRNQPFEGIVIAKKGSGMGRTFTVRRVGVGGIGVERIFPVHSPKISTLEVVKSGDVRRSKLYYLRDRVGKGAVKVKERAQKKEA